MKAILEFNLPEDKTEYIWALNAGRMAGAITEHMNTTRGWLKHGHEFKTPDEAIDACRDLMLDYAAAARGEE